MKNVERSWIVAEGGLSVMIPNLFRFVPYRHSNSRCLWLLSDLMSEHWLVSCDWQSFFVYSQPSQLLSGVSSILDLSFLLPPPLLPKEFKFCALTQFIKNSFCLLPAVQIDIAVVWLSGPPEFQSPADKRMTARNNHQSG
jgi:hypothetical protein